MGLVVGVGMEGKGSGSSIISGMNIEELNTAHMESYCEFHRSAHFYQQRILITLQLL